MASTSEPPAASNPRIDYDLYLRVDNARFSPLLSNRGVRLAGDRIGWTIDGDLIEAPLRDIASVRLMANPSLPLWIFVCWISFKNGSRLRVLSGNFLGVADSDRGGLYRDFVRELHARLAAEGRAHPRFIRGLTAPRHNLALVANLASAVVFLLLPLLRWLTRGGVFSSIELLFGAALNGVLFRTTGLNAPGEYDAGAIPPELIEPPTLRGSLLPISDRALARARAPLLGVAAVGAVLGIVWIAGVRDTDRMLVGDQARQAFAAIQRKAGGRVHVRHLQVSPREVFVQSVDPDGKPYEDDDGYLSHEQTWRVAHKSMFGGWREWDQASGPDPASHRMEDWGEPFDLDSADIPDLSQMTQAAVARAALETTSVVANVMLDEGYVETLPSKQPHWSVRVASQAENATVWFDLQGHPIGVNLDNTNRARNLDLPQGGPLFDGVVAAIREKLGDRRVVRRLAIAPRLITAYVAEKTNSSTVRYLGGLNGLIERTPLMTSLDTVAEEELDGHRGRFALDEVDWTRLPALRQKARETLSMPDGSIVSIGLALPPPGHPESGIGPMMGMYEYMPDASGREVEWTIALRDAGGTTKTAVLDTSGFVISDGTPRPAEPAPPSIAQEIVAAQALAEAGIAESRRDRAGALVWYRKAAEAGSVPAQFELGLAYENGQGVPRDYAQALSWYRQAADRGHATSQSNLGRLYALGHGVAPDDVEAARWYRKAALQGLPEAQSNMGISYATGHGVTQDLAEAMRWYRKAADQGFAPAQNLLGGVYAHGDGVAADFAQALVWYRKAADQGNSPAELHLGTLYANGQGVTRDYAEAARWYEKAAEQGEAAAQYNLGVFFDRGLGVPRDPARARQWMEKAAAGGDEGAARWLKSAGAAPVSPALAMPATVPPAAPSDAAAAFEKGRAAETRGDHAEAARWYRQAADAGVPEGQFNLGILYDKGQGVARDANTAIELYRKAADQGLVEAQANLGVHYAQGLGVARDDAEAVRWYRKAADGGNPEAQYNLGYMYANGRAVGLDHAEARRWFQKAAEQGNADARYSLGVLYNEGLGVAEDKAEALRWFRAAADQGVVSAQYNTAFFYMNGQGTAQDYGQALRWFREAAKQNVPEAQFYVGYLFANGLGVAADGAEAARWYKQAADRGLVDAQYDLGALYADGHGVPRDLAQARQWMEKAAQGGNTAAMAWLKTVQAP